MEYLEIPGDVHDKQQLQFPAVLANLTEEDRSILLYRNAG
jgi:hypothetical protein